MHQGTLVVTGQQGVEFTGPGPERVGEGLGDPSRVGVHERRMPDRIGGHRRCQLLHPFRFGAAGDRPEYAVDETGSGRIEFDAGLFDGGGYRGMRLDPGTQQLVGAQAQQVEQHRIDLLGWAPGCRSDDRVEQPRLRQAP